MAWARLRRAKRIVDWASFGSQAAGNLVHASVPWARQGELAGLAEPPSRYSADTLKVILPCPDLTGTVGRMA